MTNGVTTKRSSRRSAVGGPSSPFFLGGITCSGKSTVAHILAGRYGLAHYNADDHFHRHVESASRDGAHTVWAFQNDEAWNDRFRESGGQARARLMHTFYRERFGIIHDDICQMGCSVIVDGADLMPESVMAVASPDRAAWLVCTREFQAPRYAERDWADGPPDEDGWAYFPVVPVFLDQSNELK